MYIMILYSGSMLKGHMEVRLQRDYIQKKLEVNRLVSFQERFTYPNALFPYITTLMELLM